MDIAKDFLERHREHPDVIELEERWNRLRENGINRIHFSWNENLFDKNEDEDILERVREVNKLFAAIENDEFEQFSFDDAEDVSRELKFNDSRKLEG